MAHLGKVEAALAAQPLEERRKTKSTGSGCSRRSLYDPMAGIVCSIQASLSGGRYRSRGYVERPSSPFSPGTPFLEPKPKSETAKKERRDPLKTARYYQSLLDTGKFESRAALARYLGVSRARVTQVLRRMQTQPDDGSR